MKVIIVEPEKHVVRKVIRTLYSIDSSIEVLPAVKDVETLLKRINTAPLPDLVLINRQILGTTHRNIEAKLIITSSSKKYFGNRGRVAN